MSFLVNPVGTDRCVYLSYEGEMSPLELSAARYEANGVLDRQHWKRIVVDVTRLRSDPKPPEIYDFASGLAADVPRGTRVALVIRPEQTCRANLVQKVARNKGVFLTYFLEPEKATAWVKQSEPRRQPLVRELATNP